MKTNKALKTFLSVLTLGLLLHAVLPVVCPAGKTITISIGQETLPYGLPQEDAGITLDIIRTALEPEGYNVKPKWYPYGRRLIAFKQGKVDVTCDVVIPYMEAHQLEGHLSVPAIVYDNIAISLRKNNLDIKTIKDMAKYRVISWQGAHKVMGPEYAKMARVNKNYSEISDQRAQVLMMFMGRVDLVQGGKTIIYYWRNQIGHTGNVDVHQPIDVFPLFGEIWYSYLFRDQTARDIFDRNFKKMKKDGRYEKIIEKYTRLDPKK